MKIAIMHDYFDEIGGAELTLLHLARALDAPVITTNIAKKRVSELGFADVRFISIGRVPAVAHVKQMAAKLRFQLCNFQQAFDVFIFGGFCSIFAAKRHRNNLWYCFSPQMGLYELRYTYFSRYNIFAQAVISLFVMLDQQAARAVSRFVAPSKHVQQKIRKCYKRQSSVVYSPVSAFSYKPHDHYWLCVSRIDPCKGLDKLLKVFARLPQERLVVVGAAAGEHQGYFARLRKGSPANVQFVGGVYDRRALAQYYARCKGFVTASTIEGFGMNVVEAMAAGKPVIAPARGGHLETMVDGATGRLLDKLDSAAFVKAIQKVGAHAPRYRKACEQQAQRFDTDAFVRNMKKEIANLKKGETLPALK